MAESPAAFFRVTDLSASCETRARIVAPCEIMQRENPFFHQRVAGTYPNLDGRRSGHLHGKRRATHDHRGTGGRADGKRVREERRDESQHGRADGITMNKITDARQKHKFESCDHGCGPSCCLRREKCAVF